MSEQKKDQAPPMGADKREGLPTGRESASAADDAAFAAVEAVLMRAIAMQHSELLALMDEWRRRRVKW